MGCFIMEIERIIGRYSNRKKGPLFIALAAIHGNEQAGIHALRRVFSHLEAYNPAFIGEIAGITGNLQAVRSGRRFMDMDLNRQWYPEKVERLSNTRRAELELPEEIEQKELMILFERLKKHTPYNPIILIDFHTTSASGGTFAICNENQHSLNIAKNLGVPVITGIEGTVSGTTLHYFRDLGLCAFGFEAGQHDELASIDRMEAAVWLSLERIGCIKREDIPEFDKHHQALHKLGEGIPGVVSFSYRHPVKSEDAFEMKPGYRNFQPIAEGEVLANDKSGPIAARKDGMILMPLYQKQGEDGFFIVTELAN